MIGRRRDRDRRSAAHAAKAAHLAHAARVAGAAALGVVLSAVPATVVTATPAVAAIPVVVAATTSTTVTAGAAAVRTVADERREKDDYFRDNPMSPLRAFARYDFAAAVPGEPEPSVVVGSAPDSGVRLDGPGILPQHMRLTVLGPERGNGPWRFRIDRLAPGAAIRIGGKDWPAAPTRVIDEDTLIEAGPFAVRPYVQSDAGILIEFDRRRTEGNAFVPPAWFTVDPAWVFRASLQRYKEPETMSILTSLGRRKEYLRIGYFEIEPPVAPAAAPEAPAATPVAPAAAPRPAPLRVYAYRPTFIAQAAESLSILFTDGTTGAESYATGRYLDLGPPQAGLYTIDFNRAYNPLCAYTHVYNCPIPPRENALPIAVRAGEKSWPGRPRH